MPLSVPRIREYLDPPVKVGFPDSTTFVENWGYEALLVSEGHARLPRRTRWLAYDKQHSAWSGGGPFYMCRVNLRHEGRVDFQKWIHYGLGGPLTLYGVGDLKDRKFPTRPLDLFPTWKTKAEELQAHVPKAYQRTRPGNPKAGLLQFLYELRDLPALPGRAFYGRKVTNPDPTGALRKWLKPGKLLPDTLRDKAKFFKGLGGEYLNVVFGWAPFVDDLRKLFELSTIIDAEIAKLRKENGKWLRRRVTLEDAVVDDDPVVFDVPYTYWNVGGQPPEVWFRNTRTIVKKTVRQERKVWASGSFRYWIPNVRSVQWEDRARLALSGSLPTPELIWRVYPFTWLTDWFVDIGTVMSNLSPNAVDNLVTRYFYVMEHKKYTERWTAFCQHDGSDAAGWLEWPEQPGATFASNYTLETKARLAHGNPFSPEIPSGPLSAGKLGILAALGLSQGIR
jgi:hypothetical protein